MELKCELQVQVGFKEYFRRDKSRGNFNINNKSQVLQSLVGDSKFPKEGNQDNFLSGSREILQGVGVSAGGEGGYKIHLLTCIHCSKVACWIPQRAPTAGEGEAALCHAAEAATWELPPFFAAGSEGETSRAQLGRALASLAPWAARPRPGVPRKPILPGSPKPRSLWGPTRVARGRERSRGGCLAPARYPPEQTGEGMTRGTKTAAAAAAAAPGAAAAAAEA